MYTSLFFSAFPWWLRVAANKHVLPDCGAGFPAKANFDKNMFNLIILTLICLLVTNICGPLACKDCQ